MFNGLCHAGAWGSLGSFGTWGSMGTLSPWGWMGMITSLLLWAALWVALLGGGALLLVRAARRNRAPAVAQPTVR